MRSGRHLLRTPAERLVYAAFLAVLTFPVFARATTPAAPPAAGAHCERACGGELTCEIEATRCLLAAGLLDEAIERARALVAKSPGETA
ncbi:MAG: hypothetical protein V1750_09240, partial [Acidobacteriota bacterium]